MINGIYLGILFKQLNSPLEVYFLWREAEPLRGASDFAVYECKRYIIRSPEYRGTRAMDDSIRCASAMRSSAFANGSS
ncbi:MAG: hypothetical protein M0P13_12675 [Fibrobacteraceae bacterium]|nr:hypothetical protein [Fibrobacteraceae bacterium]